MASPQKTGPAALRPTRPLLRRFALALPLLGYHSLTWFRVMPKTLPPLPVSARTVTALGLALVLGVSAAVLASVSVAAVSAAVPAAASAESEAEDEERRERELAESRRLSAVLDAGDDDLALPREPDGLLEPRDSAGDDD